MKKITSEKILYLFLLLQPIIDLFTSLITRFSDTSFTIGTITRGLFLLLLVFYTTFFTKTKYKKKTIFYFISIFIFTSLYFFTKKDILKFNFLKTEIVYFFKYFYFPIVSVCLINCFKSLKLDKKIINKIFGFNAVIFSILILIPFITNTGFNSYLDSSKGSVGWFYSANEVGAILTMLFPYLYCILNRQEIKKFIIYSVFLVTSMIIIGTKTAFLGMLLTEIVFLVYFILVRTTGKRMYACVFVCALSLVLVPIIPATDNIQSSIENNLEEDIKDDDEIMVNATIDKTLNIILSGRQNFLYNTIEITNDVNIVDKLFGIGFVNRESIDDKDIEKLIEIDPLDIFFHYGLVGFVLYFLPLIYIYAKTIYNTLKRKLYLTFYQLLYLYSISLLLVISFIAGHIFSSPAVSIYLCFILVMLYNEINIIPKSELKDNEITILALHLGFGGVEKYISSLCKMFEKKYKINIICTYKLLDKPAFYFSDNVNITYLIDGKPNKEELMAAINSKNILNIIKEGINSIKILYLRKNRNIKAIKKIDTKYIITTRTFHNKLVSIYANTNIIKIATEHNYHNNDKKYINKLIKSIKKFDYFVVVSNTLKEFYNNKIGKTMCVYIPNVIDDLPKESTKLEEDVLINVGRLEYEKGHSDLIDVIYEVKKEIKDIKLYLIGNGSKKEELNKKISKLGLNDNIVLTGYLSQEEMKDYYLKSKLFVMTSYTESFGLVLIEAMSYKVPCIAFDSADGARELLKDSNGVLIKNRDKIEMTKEIVKLLQNEKKLKELSVNGYSSCKKYLLDNVSDEWFELLNRE